MKTVHGSRLDDILSRLPAHLPFSGQLELTYRCNYKCAHCYCRGSEKKGRELSLPEIKRILGEARESGCLWLTITGGECLLRPDFEEIYLYAKKLGLLVTVFTNGWLLNKRIRELFSSAAPYSVEVTVNGITEKTYSAVTGVKGRLSKVLENVKALRRAGVSAVIKTNLLKQNKHEVAAIKRWADDNLGKTSDNRHCFHFDPMIYPRLNGDFSPCAFRLDLGEVRKIYGSDSEFLAEWKKEMAADIPDLERDEKFLYECNTWKSQFIVDPFGRLKFCEFSDKFGCDLRKTSLKEGFYKIFPKIARTEFKTDSKCRGCGMRGICGWCPARAFLETGNEEAPVPFYCKRGRDLIRLGKK